MVPTASTFLFGILVILRLAPASATPFHISALSKTTDYRLYPFRVHTYPDLTVLATLSASYYSRISELRLHPAVNITGLPPPRHQQSLTILVRYHRRTGVVRWARAFSSFEEQSFSTDVDRAGNIFIAALLKRPSLDRSLVCKLSPDGSEQWCSRFAKRSGKAPSPHYIRFAADHSLVLPASPSEQVVVMNPRNGLYRRSVQLVSPKQFRGQELTGMDASATTACLLGSKEEEVVQGKQTFYREVIRLHCASLRNGAMKMTRVMDSLPGHAFPRFASTAMEPSPRRNGKCAAVFLAYERAYQFDYNARRGRSNAKHEIVVQKMCSHTLQDMCWREDERGGCADTTAKIFAFPTPLDSQFVAAIHGVRFIRRTRSLVMMFATTVNLTGSAHVSGRKVVLEGNGREYVWPPVQWLVFIDNGRLPKLVAVDPRFNSDISVPSPFTTAVIEDFAVTTSQRKVVAMGILSRVSFRNGGELGSGWPHAFEVDVPSDSARES